MHASAGTEPAVALCRQEFEDLVVRQLEAYTEKPAEVQDLRNACRHVLTTQFYLHSMDGHSVPV